MNHEQHQDNEQRAHVTLGSGSGKTHSFAAIMQRLKDRSRKSAPSCVRRPMPLSWVTMHMRWLTSTSGAATTSLRRGGCVWLPTQRPWRRAGPRGDRCQAAGLVASRHARQLRALDLAGPGVPGVRPRDTGDKGRAEVCEEAERPPRCRLSASRLADAMRRLEKARRTIAKLFAEAEQVQSAAKQIRQDAHHAADVILREAKQQAEVIIADAQRSASGLGEERSREQKVGASRRVRRSEGEERWQVRLYDSSEVFGSAADESPKLPAASGGDEVYIPQALWQLVWLGNPARAFWEMAADELRAVSVHRRQDDSLPVLPRPFEYSPSQGQ